MDDRQYFSRSWALLTHDKGWYKPLLVMMCSSLVPIAGDLGNRGYALEWARLTAWGVDSSPKQKNVQVGRCIASGWRGFLVEFGWSLIFALIYSAVVTFASALPGFLGDFFGFIVGVLGGIATLLWTSITGVAALRAAIYERAGAGYRFDRVFEMIKLDRRGFGRIFCISLVSNLLMGAISFCCGIIIALELTPALIVGGYMGDSSSFLSALSGTMVWLVLTAAIFVLAVSFVANAVRMLVYTATGLWMRQFNVPNWGRSADPLPVDVSPAEEDDAPVIPFSPRKAEPEVRHEQREPEARTSVPALSAPVSTPTPAAEAPAKGVDEQEAEELFSAMEREAKDNPIAERSVDELLADLDALKDSPLQEPTDTEAEQ